MTVHCSVPYSVVHVLLLVHEPFLNVRYAWGNGEAARAAVLHCLSLDTCQGNTTSVNRHKAYRRIGASMRCGTRLRKGKLKTMGMKKCNMPWVREGVSIPVWCNGMCAIGSWERPELRDRVRCCFDGLRACGNEQEARHRTDEPCSVAADCVTRRWGQGHGLQKPLPMQEAGCCYCQSCMSPSASAPLASAGSWTKVCEQQVYCRAFLLM